MVEVHHFFSEAPSHLRSSVLLLVYLTPRKMFLRKKKVHPDDESYGLGIIQKKSHCKTRMTYQTILGL